MPLANLAPVTAAAPAVAALTEPLAVALRGVSLGDVGPDSRVLVLGAGTIGLGAALLARDRAAEVAITARHPHQAAAAEALGVTVLGESEGVGWATTRAVALRSGFRSSARSFRGFSVCSSSSSGAGAPSHGLWRGPARLPSQRG